MNMRDKLQKLFQEIFENDDIILRDELSPENWIEWDSLKQMQLVLGMEETFGIKFTTSEILAINDISSILDILNKKLK